MIGAGKTMTEIAFSCIISVYVKEQPRFLSQCLDSIVKQTVLPDELIIVKDGPLTDDLETVLREFQYPNELKIVPLPENVTQGPARAEGIQAAKHEWVAVMDSDDICRPDRFEKQLEMITRQPELSIIGGQISEFEDDPKHSAAKRTVPCKHDEIIKFAKKRNPFNQMTVMFKRSAAIVAGNYRYFPGFEDYDLWVRMIADGAICANHPDILVDARVGGGMYSRRRGLSYVRAEWRMQKMLKSLGLINALEFVRNVTLRIPVRLLPKKAVKAFYNLFAR